MGLSADNVLRPVVLFLVFCLDDKSQQGTSACLDCLDLISDCAAKTFLIHQTSTIFQTTALPDRKAVYFSPFCSLNLFC